MPDASGTTPLPRAEIEHRIPGRMRLRVPAKRGDAGFFQKAEAVLAGMPGVRSARADPRTAGILVEHDGDGVAVLAAAREQDLFAAVPDRAVRAPGRVQAEARSGAASAGLPASPLDIAALGLAGAGVLQFARGQVVGSASENLWNAYSLYAVTRQALPSAFLVAFGLLQIARGEVLGSATSLFLYAYAARRMAQHRAAEEAI